MKTKPKFLGKCGGKRCHKCYKFTPFTQPSQSLGLLPQEEIAIESKEALHFSLSASVFYSILYNQTSSECTKRDVTQTCHKIRLVATIKKNLNIGQLKLLTPGVMGRPTAWLSTKVASLLKSIVVACYQCKTQLITCHEILNRTRSH